MPRRDVRRSLPRPASFVTVIALSDPLSVGVTQITDPNQQLTARTWDPKSGNLASAIDPLNHTMSQTWDPVYGFVTSRSDLKGVTASFTYDSGGGIENLIGGLP